MQVISVDDCLKRLDKRTDRIFLTAHYRINHFVFSAQNLLYIIANRKKVWTCLQVLRT